MTVRETLKEFAGYTSLHGMGRISDSVHVIQRVIWVILVLIGFGITSLQLYRLGFQYRKEQVNTKVSHVQQTLSFPAVTVCNLNPVEFEFVIAKMELFQVIERLSELTDVPLGDFNVGNYGQLSNPNYTYPTDLQLTIENKYLDAMTIFQQRLNNLTDDELTYMTRKTSQFLFSCRFQGVNCDGNNFTLVRIGKYGYCYEFISGFSIESAGPDRGLELVLNVKQDNYVPFVTQGAGVRVDVHPPSFSSLMEVNGISVPTGFDTDISIKKSTNSRLPGRDKKCDSKNTYESIVNCIIECLNNQVKDKCYCAADIDQVDHKDDFPIVPCESQFERECMSRILRNSIVSELCPHCKIPCNDEIYHKSLSMTTWPSKNYEPILISDLPNTAAYNNLKDDLVKVNVFYSSLIVTQTEEEEAYSFENFISDIGGTLGLLIGMSCLSIGELFELAILLIMKCARPKNNTVESVEIKS